MDPCTIPLNGEKSTLILCGLAFQNSIPFVLSDDSNTPRLVVNGNTLESAQEIIKSWVPGTSGVFSKDMKHLNLHQYGKNFGVLDLKLKDQQYLVGNELSYSDLLCFIMLFSKLFCKLDDYPHIKSWVDRIRQKIDDKIWSLFTLREQKSQPSENSKKTKAEKAENKEQDKERQLQISSYKIDHLYEILYNGIRDPFLNMTKETGMNCEYLSKEFVGQLNPIDQTSIVMSAKRNSDTINHVLVVIQEGEYYHYIEPAGMTSIVYKVKNDGTIGFFKDQFGSKNTIQYSKDTHTLIHMRGTTLISTVYLDKTLNDDTCQRWREGVRNLTDKNFGIRWRDGPPKYVIKFKFENNALVIVQYQTKLQMDLKYSRLMPTELPPFTGEFETLMKQIQVKARPYLTVDELNTFMEKLREEAKSLFSQWGINFIEH